MASILQPPRSGQENTTGVNKNVNVSDSKMNIGPQNFLKNPSPEVVRKWNLQIMCLRYLTHSSRCRLDKCIYSHCKSYQEIWSHISSCNIDVCPFPKCSKTKRLIDHHKECRHIACPVCIPVKHNFCSEGCCPVCIPLRQKIRHAKKLLKKNKPKLVKSSELQDDEPELQIIEKPPQKRVKNDEAAEMGQKMEAEKDACFLREDATKYHENLQVVPARPSVVVEVSSPTDLVTAPQVKPVQVEESRLPSIPGIIVPESAPQPLAPTVKPKSRPKLQPRRASQVDLAVDKDPESSTKAPDVDNSKAKESQQLEAKPVVRKKEAKPSQVEQKQPKRVKGSEKQKKSKSIEKKVEIVEPKVEIEQKHQRKPQPKVEIKPEPQPQPQLKPQVKPQPHPIELEKKHETLEEGSLSAAGVGASLLEFFTVEMIEEHLKSLRDSVSDLEIAEDTVDICKLCNFSKFSFDPPPIYCASCNSRVKRMNFYFTAGQGEQRLFLCNKCPGKFKTDVTVEGYPQWPKNKLEKRFNNEVTDEPWVECDNCKTWVHQVCGLFNARRNEGDNTVFSCGVCFIDQMKKGLRKPLPPTGVLGAKDLPKNILSDELEARLAKKLAEERLQRASAQRLQPDQVPGADELVIRVVSSVDKVFETKPNFAGIFGPGEYPSEFPYKSKVVLLFQRIEGVEVCLFGMYVQEFGSECGQPNSRRVYLSYLDSVKYFRPNVRTQTNEALRTYVYHEILIGYLEHCKKRGFTSCYIWACPPLKGEDYILYCHPENQKTPQPSKLREWYLNMLKKAKDEGIVVETKNFHELFFVKSGESRAPVRAARLPYFDGDYWPGAIEDVLHQMQEEEQVKQEDIKKIVKKGKKPAKRNAARMEEEVPASKDELIMTKLGDSILSMKEDFIMVHLYHCCTHCNEFILGDRRWTCNTCPDFDLCQKCFEVERTRHPRDRHPVCNREAHNLVARPLKPAPSSTEDRDEIMESEFFDTRQAFLSLCQGNHYQYDTLRRAKHSSMMMLYHLHNPTAPAFVSSCNVCQGEIDPGQGYRCEQCDYDVCDICFRDQPPTHPHPLVAQAAQDTTAQNQAGRNMRISRKRKIQDLLRHAARCNRGPSNICDVSRCQNMHKLFKHGQDCEIRVAKGCRVCRQMWQLLKFHAKNCKENNCNVPRCRDLRSHIQRLTQQSEGRRIAAFQEMMRQRASENKRARNS